MKDERLKKILTESHEFSEKCAETMLRSKNLVRTSFKLANETQFLIEEAMIKKEEMIAKKCEALSVLEFGFDKEGLSEDPHVYHSYKEEQQVVLKMLETIKHNHISKENVALTKLKDKFFDLSFVPKAYDITGRAEMERTPPISEELYREYFEENIAGAYISSPEGDLIACNQEYKRIFGFDSTQQALDTPISELFIGQTNREIFLNLLKKEKRVTGHKPRLKKVDGTPIHVVENSSGVFDDFGNLKYIRGFLLDISEQKKLKDQLLQAQKMEAIGTLAGGVAHDINNILAGIIGNAQLAELHMGEPIKAKKNINNIVEGSLKAAALIRQILTVKRQSEYKKRPLNVFALLKETLKLLRSTIPSNIELRENIFSRAKIMADSAQTQQVIMNLCTNAYRAMSDTGGILTVGLQEIEVSEKENIPDLNMLNGNYLKLEVSDTAHGLGAELIGKIFDPYFTAKDMEKGTGLGLGVVNGIVKNQDGFIKSHSNADLGSTFQVFWPVISE